MSARERTGWRDLMISSRHRDWGWAAPCVDIDFMVAEYSTGRVVAGVEYKHERRGTDDLVDYNGRLLGGLFEDAGKPAFLCRYAADLSWFEVSALNERGRRWMPGRARFDELGWVGFLYALRGLAVPSQIVEALTRSPGAAFAARFPTYTERGDGSIFIALDSREAFDQGVRVGRAECEETHP